MAQLIINSDDYCRTSEISRGVREAHSRGVVTSTTCMMNFPNAADDIALALKETPDLGLGVHLVLTSGPPLSPPEEVPTLVTAENRFPGLAQFLSGMSEVEPGQVKKEWKRQIEKFVSLTGCAPTHLDSHHHSSYYTKEFFQAMLELAQEYGCAIRQVTSNEGSWLPEEVQATILDYAQPLMKEFEITTTDAFYGSFYDEQATKEEISGILRRLPESGVFELMCHPGYSDAGLEASSIYNRQRERELEVLTDQIVLDLIKNLDIELVTFAVLGRQ
jgi:predicted glycoside hydrolase/deacetylase ChbG (UPF0249 family)